MDCLDKQYRRYGRLLSVLDVTNSRLGDANLLLTHTDSSFLEFDPRHPSPWLEDIGQATYLLRNHRQIIQHGRAGFMSRLLLLPNLPPVVGPDTFVYYAAVKGVVHLQLYEGIRLWVAFVDQGAALDMSFNITMEQVGKHVRVWPSPDYYTHIENRELKEAHKAEAEEYQKDLKDALSCSIRLAPYRDEHFTQGLRTSLPRSWKQFLVCLTGQKCTSCFTSLSAGDMQIDHGRALHPEEDQCRPTPSGNSNLFNLAALCKKCNQIKSNKGVFFPEKEIPSLLPDLRLREYFKTSLQVPPSLSKHELPERAPANGQFP